MSFTVEGRVAFPSFLLELPVSRKPCMQGLLHAFSPWGMEEEEMLPGVYCCFLSCLSSCPL